MLGAPGALRGPPPRSGPPPAPLGLLRGASCASPSSLRSCSCAPTSCVRSASLASHSCAFCACASSRSESPGAWQLLFQLGSEGSRLREPPKSPGSAWGRRGLGPGWAAPGSLSGGRSPPAAAAPRAPAPARDSAAPVPGGLSAPPGEALGRAGTPEAPRAAGRGCDQFPPRRQLLGDPRPRDGPPDPVGAGAALEAAAPSPRTDTALPAGARSPAFGEPRVRRRLEPARTAARRPPAAPGLPALTSAERAQAVPLSGRLLQGRLTRHTQERPRRTQQFRSFTLQPGPERPNCLLPGVGG